MEDNQALQQSLLHNDSHCSGVRVLASGDTDCGSDADLVNSITLFVLHNNGYYKRGNTQPAVLGRFIQCLDT